MESLDTLQKFARAGAAQLARAKDLAAYEIYCSSAEHHVARINYTSDIPSRGLEEFKSLNASGFALRIVLRDDPHLVGTATVGGDFSTRAVRDALEKARGIVVNDPHFSGLPVDPQERSTKRKVRSDLLRISDQHLASNAWGALSSAIETFEQKTPLKMARPGLVIGGDFSLIRDRVAIAGSGLAGVRTDENAFFVASITALIESLETKGTATAIGSSLAAMEQATGRLGREAVTQALELRHGERPPGGTYRVVLGPQPIAEILNYAVIGSLTARAFHAASSAYIGRFGMRVMDSRLTMIDDPTTENGCVRRAITCEGLPAAETELIRDGVLVGLLSNHYDRNRLLTDDHRAGKLGPNTPASLDFRANSGHRLGEGATRRFDAAPRACGTDVIIKSRGGVGEKALIATVRDGLYIGRVWYTYPINGQRAGDFTCTISGDSYVIRDGKIAAPLAPNCLRINANIDQVFAHPLAVGRESKPAVVWGAPEAYFVPALAVEGLRLTPVNLVEQS
jgi:hypothetical protein